MPHIALNKHADEQAIVVVSGLPRSGTSMMMGMLEAGGMPLLVDRARASDADNPKGYFEFEPVKRIASNQAWLPAARGKAVKIVSFLLPHTSATFTYKIIFMHRALPEVLASQKRMLWRRGEDALHDDVKMMELYEKHVRGIEEWIAQQPCMEVLFVNYRDTLSDPRKTSERVNAFLNHALNVEAMAARVDSTRFRTHAQGGAQT